MSIFARLQKAKGSLGRASPAGSGSAHFGQGREVASLLRSQRLNKNDAGKRWTNVNAFHGVADSIAQQNSQSTILNPSLQPSPKLRMFPMSAVTNASNDPYEREADRIAESVLRMPAPITPITDRVAGAYPWHGMGKPDDPKGIQTTVDANANKVSQIVPLPEPRIRTENSITLSHRARAFFEPRFGVDFANVRVHADGNAARMSRALGAKAFTRGNDIYFNSGMYDADSAQGKRLLAHELAHVVQQNGGRRSHQSNGKISRAPENTIQRAIQDVQQDELVTFMSQPEDSLPQALLNKYLLEPTLMATQRRVMIALINRVQAGEAPLSADGLQTLVLGEESDQGTALMICHNVTKALARGSSHIAWSNVSRSPDPLVYSLNGGNYTFDPARFHPDAIKFGSRNQESVFYAMLSADQFGIGDEGNWYHYFALATISYYAASGNMRPPGGGPDAVTPTGSLVRAVADALRDHSVTASPAYDSWLIANAVSFLEGGFYGLSQAEVNAESNVHIRGAAHGLAAVDRIPDENWQWHIPAAGSILFTDFANFQFRSDMIASTLTEIDGNVELTIVSGTLPSDWFETPDPYVKLMGTFATWTTTKTDTTTPVWNEVLTTLRYGSLTSVTLQLYDDDLVFNDHIADFTHDLRLQGQRSRTFALTSGGATLEVKVEALGDIVLTMP